LCSKLSFKIPYLLAIICKHFFKAINAETNIYGFGSEVTEETASTNEQPSDDPLCNSPLIEGLPLVFGDR